MASYYVNRNAQWSGSGTGEHEVHTSICTYLPLNKTYLGEFSNCSDAVRYAKTRYPNVDGCYYCARACHTR
jgi:hypothetical protein